LEERKLNEAQEALELEAVHIAAKLKNERHDVLGEPIAHHRVKRALTLLACLSFA
jgi:hypothetical protein